MCSPTTTRYCGVLLLMCECMCVLTTHVCTHPRMCVRVCALMVHFTLSNCWTTTTLAHCVDSPLVFLSASAYICTYIQGIPIVYYGTEQGYSGGNDPSNRESLWPNFNTNHPIYKVRTDLHGSSSPGLYMLVYVETNKQTA